MTAPDPISLLMIEDQPSYTEFVRKYTEGFIDRIVACETLAAAEPFFPAMWDIIWFDLHLPGTTDIQAIEKVDECRRRNGDTVIVVVSGYIDDKLRKLAEQAGADAVVDKHEALTGIQIVSLILLGVMRAQARGAKGKCLEIFERASKLMAEKFPQSQEPYVTT